MRLLLIAISLILLAEFGWSQNVGIGTTSPIEKLHVAGNIKTDTIKPDAIKFMPNASAGKLLTSDAVGNASWQPSSVTNVGAAAGNIGYGVWGDCATNGNISEYQPVGDLEDSAEYLGVASSISGNFAFVGALFTNSGSTSNAGAVYVYKYNGENWGFFQKITGELQQDAIFGKSVSVNGNYAIIGCPGADNKKGSASIYKYDGTNWLFMQRITDAAGVSQDEFGYSVSISGKYAIIGVPYDDLGTSFDQGSAIIFELVGNSWVQRQKLVASTGAIDDNFGSSVSISGNYAIVGAPNDDDGTLMNTGSVCIFWFSGSTWVQRFKTHGIFSGSIMGKSVSIDSNYAVAGVPGTEGGGEAVVFTNTGNHWSAYSKKIISRSGIEPYDEFGSSVSISGDNILIGSVRAAVGTSILQGSASLFKKVANNWQLLQFITDPSGQSYDALGSSVSINASVKRFIIGAYGAFNTGKAIFGKVN